MVANIIAFLGLEKFCVIVLISFYFREESIEERTRFILPLRSNN